MKHLAWLFALAACTDFEAIDRDVCGNGLLEAGEDCDSSDPSCVSCAVACTTSADCPTSDYACGVDGLCHAPGGALGQPRAAGTFGADELRVTDIDRDGIGDAVGLSRTSMILRHGDAAAQLDGGVSILTPTQTGPAAFGDLDNDGSLDVVLSTPDGLVSYASPYGELAPVAVNSSLVDQQSLDALDIRMMFYLAPSVFAGFIVDPDTNQLVMLTIDGNAPAAVQATGDHVEFYPPCAARLGPIDAAAFDPNRVDIYPVIGESRGRYDTVLALRLGSGPSAKFCVVSIHRDIPPLFGAYPSITFADITPSGFGVPARRPVLADLGLETDGDDCPGIVKSDAGLASLQYWSGSRVTANAPCTFAASPATLPALNAPPGTELVGRVPIAPADIDYVEVATDGLVTTEGVYPFLPNGYLIVVPPSFVPVYQTIRTIERVDSGDLDGDGGVDLVIAAKGEDDLDVLFRVLGEPGFNLVRLDTASAVTSVTVGDYDGNRIRDIAYTELFEDHERLMVAFGTTDRPLEPVAVGVFSAVTHVSLLSVPDSVDYLGVAEDLIVLQPPMPGSTSGRASILHGSPQRTLLSYFDPRIDSLRAQTMFRGAVIGHFAPGTSGVEYTDLFAMAPPAANVGSSSTQVKAWRVPGTSDGLDGTPTAGVDVSGVIDCSRTIASGLCLDTARYVAFPTGENHDVVIGLDRGGRSVMVDPWAMSPVTAVALTALAETIPERTIPRSLHAEDIDGDGVTDLLVTFAPTASDAMGAIVLCAVQDGVPQQCDDLAPAIQSAASAAGIDIAQCFDATPARLSFRGPTTGANPAADVIVACRGDGTVIFRVRRTADGDAVDRLVSLPGRVRSLRAGDVTGDGVDDLVMLEGDSVTSLVVYPQCTSRDLACMEGGQ